MPDKSIVDEIQVTVVEVYPAKTWQGKSVQDVKLADASGQIKASLWEHPDATPLKGKEFILHSSKSGNGRFGGVQVKNDNVKYPASLSISKSGIFQHVQVYHQQSGQPAVEQKPASHDVPTPQPASGPRPINGQTVGMAVNNACANLTARGETLNPKVIKIIASSLIKVAGELERGELDFGDNENPF